MTAATIDRIARLVHETWRELARAAGRPDTHWEELTDWQRHCYWRAAQAVLKALGR